MLYYYNTFYNKKYMLFR